jgi:hypothetical protein
MSKVETSKFYNGEKHPIMKLKYLEILNLSKLIAKILEKFSESTTSMKIKLKPLTKIFKKPLNNSKIT